MINKFFEDIKNNNIRKLNNLVNIEGEDLFLYGAGNIGKKLVKNLLNTNVNIVGFLDKNNNLPRVIENIDVYFPEEDTLDKYKENAIVILSALFDLNQTKNVKEYLYNIGFKKVFLLSEVNLKIHISDLFGVKFTIDEMEIISNKVQIEKVYDLLEEKKDKEFYINYLKSFITNDYSFLPRPLPIDLQYLAHDIDISKDYTTFIDCGAYDGDTLRNLSNKGVILDNVIAFEPQNELHEKLIESINSMKIKAGIVIPCGVYDDVVTLKFNKNTSSLSSSSITEEGNEIIQCTSIDKSIKNIKPTFIKMDIEGAEINAINGAKDTIRKYRPQLAICVYHSLSHIWEIPLLIHEIDPTYKFYIRNYNYMGIETVLYAF